MAEKKGIFSRLIGSPKPQPKSKAAPKSPSKATPKPAAKATVKPDTKAATNTKAPTKPAGKHVAKVAPKVAPNPVEVPAPRPSSSSSGKPPMKVSQSAVTASSRPANKPLTKPGTPGVPSAGSAVTTSSRPANKPPTPPTRPKPSAQRPSSRPAVAGTISLGKPRAAGKPLVRPASAAVLRRVAAEQITSATGKRTIRELNARDKRVFLRVDFNVPLSDGKIVDDARIRAAIPTIQALLEAGASVVLASHLGRPDGKVVDGLRLRPAAERLSALMKIQVPTTGDALGVGTDDAVKRLRPGEMLLLENVRFHAAEEKNDPAFAARLASYADVFVNDAFGAAHRAHASVVGVAGILPAYIGLLMEREIETLSSLLDNPKRPFAAIVGGGKVSGKIAVLEALLRKVDLLVLGGGIANTFLVASHRSVGKSLYEPKMVEEARRILRLANERGVKVVLPVDGVVAKEVTRGTEFKIVSTEKLPASWHMVDLGPESVRQIREAIAPVETILWNGPLGVFEIPAFGAATRELAKLAAEKAEAGATVVVGGGDSIAALQQQGLAGKMTHLSTGGGASLEFLEGRELPGLAVIPMAGSPVETPPIIWHTPPPTKAAKRPAPKAAPKPAPKVETTQPEATGDEAPASEEEQ